MPLTPPQVLSLSGGGYTAVLEAQGARLRSLGHGGRELTYRLPGDVPVPPFAGAVLAPWPNRVAGGRYRFGGVTHQLPVDEVGRGNALHGLALWAQWQVASSGDGAAVFEHLLLPRPGYPFTVRLSAAYTLGADGLTITVGAENVGTSEAPVGLSAHPYLTLPLSLLDDWTLQLPCADVIVADERLLPRRTGAAAPLGLDFREPRPIGDAVLDHAFTGVAFDDAGRAAATLRGPSGDGVRVSWDTACRWLQVYTLHAPGNPMHRRAVALEPMTCAPDAFNSGDGLVVLAPGGSTSATLTIAAC